MLTSKWEGVKGGWRKMQN